MICDELGTDLDLDDALRPHGPATLGERSPVRERARPRAGALLDEERLVGR